MSTEARFSASTKDALAKRAGFHCSFPGCPVLTIGPSDESDSSTSNTGMACHIYAAGNEAPARRISLEKSPEELSDISNGIWMCYTHGKLIDTDECLYTPQTLTAWKAICETRARLKQSTGLSSDPSPKDFLGITLPHETISLKKADDETELIGQAFEMCCVEQLWGSSCARAVRDAAIELTRNAFQHGQANVCDVSIQSMWIDIADDGTFFEPSSKLIGKSSGGSVALSVLREEHGSSIVISSYIRNGKNITRFTMLRSAQDILSTSKCSFQLQRKDNQQLVENIPALLDCDTVFFVLPKHLALSDGLRFDLPLEAQALNGKKIVLIGERLSDTAVLLLKQRNPQWIVLNLEA